MPSAPDTQVQYIHLHDRYQKRAAAIKRHCSYHYILFVLQKLFQILVGWNRIYLHQVSGTGTSKRDTCSDDYKIASFNQTGSFTAVKSCFQQFVSRMSFRAEYRSYAPYQRQLTHGSFLGGNSNDL